MPAAPSAKSAFDLKSTAWTLTALRLQTADLGLLVAALDARFADSPGLFDDDAVVLDLSPLREADALLDLVSLLPHLQRHGMRPIAAQGGSVRQMITARDAGLAEAPDAQPPQSAPVTDTALAPSVGRNAAPPLPPGSTLPPARDRVVREPVSRAAAPSPMAITAAAAVAPTVTAAVPTVAANPGNAEPASAAAAAPGAATLVIDKPLRSGQRVYARGGDLVVLAVVSFGAEVIADGSIHVYGPLRGRAIAGARGNTEARIFSTCMEPQLVSIAGIYRTTETPLPANVLGLPAQVRLDGEKIRVEPLGS